MSNDNVMSVCSSASISFTYQQITFIDGNITKSLISSVQAYIWVKSAQRGQL